MRKKLLLSSLSVIALAALGIGAIADMFKPYERYELTVETMDVVLVETEDPIVTNEAIKETVNEETTIVTKQENTTQISSSEGKKEEKLNVDKAPVKEDKNDSSYQPPKEALNNKPSNTEPAKPQTDPTPVPDPKPVEKPSVPDYACPAGMDPNKPCDTIMDTSFYYATYSTQSEADNAGQYFLDDVVTIGDKEITNYSVQPVYRNDGSVAYYGLNLWSYGSLIQ